MAYGELLCHEDAPPPDEIRCSITPGPYMHSSVKFLTIVAIFKDHYCHLVKYIILSLIKSNSVY